MSGMACFECSCLEISLGTFEPLDFSELLAVLGVLEVDGENVKFDDEGDSGSKERRRVCGLFLWYLLCTWLCMKNLSSGLLCVKDPDFADLLTNRN